MTIETQIVCDSISPSGKRLTTFLLRYPRIIHAELMTHRMLSRNASSSRAIPVSKMINVVETDPFLPVHWGKNQKGMQADIEVDDETQAKATSIWLRLRDQAVEACKELTELGIHKQIANRPLEWCGHIIVVVSATEWGNFFGLRCHKDAQPEFRVLATQMKELFDTNQPAKLNPGQWHLPFVNETEKYFKDEIALKLSIARCARTSYMTHDGAVPNVDMDIALYEKLIVAEPKHMSPAEHQGRCEANMTIRSGNFVGWTQFRKTIKDECIP